MERNSLWHNKGVGCNCREMRVLNKHCSSKCELQTWSVSFEVTKKKGKKDETHKKEARELFLKPLQVFCEGFVCPLLWIMILRIGVVAFSYIFACKVK
jgi:hypothetical protein